METPGIRSSRSQERGGHDSDWCLIGLWTVRAVAHVSRRPRRDRAYPKGMTKVVVEIADSLAARLTEQAIRLGVPVEELAQRALAAYLHRDPFAFVGAADSDEVRGRDADEQLVEFGFGHS